MFNELCPLALGGKGRPRVSIPRKVDKIEIVVYSIEINRLRTTGRTAGERQPAFSCERINQAGLSDVASTQESDFRQPVGRELLGTTCTVDEFR